MESYPKRPLSKSQMMHDSVLCILQEELSQKRVALSVLLMDLLSQQAERRQQLLNTLTEMEKRRWVDEQVREYFRNCLTCAMKVPW
jgi:Mg2+/Co2+ transporter CorC